MPLLRNPFFIVENRRLLQDKGILSRIFETAATARLQVGVMLVINMGKIRGEGESGNISALMVVGCEIFDIYAEIEAVVLYKHHVD